MELIEASNLDIGLALTAIMTNAMTAAMQNFMLTGAANGYTGILQDAAINQVTAADVTYASIGEGVKAIKNNNGTPNGLILNANDAMDLSLAVDTTGQFIVPPKFMDNLNVYEVANSIASGSAVALDFSSIAWGILSEGGLQLEINRNGGEAFSRGQIQIRARFNGDFQVTNPKLVSLIAPAV